MEQNNIMLIGVGPHAKRIYFPALEKTKLNLKVVVELKENQSEVAKFVKKYYKDVEYIAVNKANTKNKYILPKGLEKKLNEAVKRLKIKGVIIATDPLNHMQYALWAEKQRLHILMDKPVSTYENIANSTSQAKKLVKDYNILLKNYKRDRAFIINAQRRFLPQFEIIQEKINAVARKYGTPITSMQSTNSDGQWRLPNEVLTLKYHPLLGYGKVSHSGYHYIDMATKLITDSFKEAKKHFDEVGVYSKFIKASGVLKMQNQKDLEKIFGKDYKKLDSRTDEELIKLYKENSEAEVDATTIITLKSEGIPVTNVTINLLHNGFSLRSWMLPNIKDLYKGNGRVRHEYHNIEQGCLQNIQIHSYQAKDKHDINNEKDLYIGGNNHYDIYIFRNSKIIGGKTLEIITAKDIIEKYKLDEGKLMNELARHEAVKQFEEVIENKRTINSLKSNITEHYLSVNLMSMIYESGIKNAEVIKKYE